MKWATLAASFAVVQALSGWVIDSTTGVVCDYVRASPNNHGVIRLRPTYLTATPVAYVVVSEARFREVGLPLPRQYQHRYSSEQARVKLPWSEVQVFDDKRGVLGDSHPKVDIDIGESGKWCVYTGFSPTPIAVEFVNDYGYLDYPHFWLYQVTFGLVVALTVIYGILKVMKACNTTIGDVTTTTVKQLLSISLIQCMWWFVANNWMGADVGVAEHQRWWVWLGHLVVQVLASVASAIGLCGLWRFARGVGTHYYTSGNAAMAKLPRQPVIAWFMLVFVVITTVASGALAVVDPRHHPIYGDQGQALPYSMMVRGTALLLHRVAWLAAIITIIVSFFQSLAAVSVHSPFAAPMRQSRALVLATLVFAAIAATTDPWHPQTSYFLASTYVWLFVIPALLKVAIIIGFIVVWIAPRRGLRLRPYGATMTKSTSSTTIADPQTTDGSRSAKEAARQAALARFQLTRVATD